MYISIHVYIYVCASIYFLICWKSDCKKARVRIIKRSATNIEEELIISLKKRKVIKNIILTYKK